MIHSRAARVRVFSALLLFLVFPAIFVSLAAIEYNSFGWSRLHRFSLFIIMMIIIFLFTWKFLSRDRDISYHDLVEPTPAPTVFFVAVHFIT